MPVTDVKGDEVDALATVVSEDFGTSCNRVIMMCYPEDSNSMMCLLILIV